MSGNGDYYDDDLPEDDDLDDADCMAIGPDRCDLAGTEYCDWCCPHMTRVFANRMRAIKAAAKASPPSQEPQNSAADKTSITSEVR